MEPVIVRESFGDDCRWAAGLMASSDPWITLRRDYEACLRTCSSAQDELRVAWSGAARCGFSLVRDRGLAGAPYLVSVAVDAPFRGRGVGAALLEEFEARFTGRSRHVFLCVSSFNPRARAFYDRRGYTAVGVIRDFMIDGADETLMVKRLPVLST